MNRSSSKHNTKVVIIKQWRDGQVSRKENAWLVTDNSIKWRVPLRIFICQRHGSPRPYVRITLAKKKEVYRREMGNNRPTLSMTWPATLF